MNRCAIVSVILATAALAASCADAEAPPTPPVALTLWNRSQFEIFEVFFHDEPSHAGATSVLQQPPLGLDEHETADFEQRYVTFVRDKTKDGPRIAFTTERSIHDEVFEDGFTLILFDDAFRLLPPKHDDNPFGDARRDGGPTGDDGGPRADGAPGGDAAPGD